MEFFINELSLNCQFESHYDFKIATDKFIDLIQAINELKLENKSTYYSSFFFSYSPLKNTRFDSELKSNRDLNNRFNENLQKLNPKTWEPHRIHLSNISYMFGIVSCTDTSVAELAERTLSNDYRGILMNFSNSIFSDNNYVNIIKARNTGTPIIVFCSFDRSSLYEWLTKIGVILPGARKFEHHKQKHDKKSPTAGNAVLLSSEEEAQQLLDTAKSWGNNSSRLYNYDKNLDKYIVFNLHSPNLYHGYHLDNPNEIPEPIRNMF